MKKRPLTYEEAVALLKQRPPSGKPARPYEELVASFEELIRNTPDVEKRAELERLREEFVEHEAQRVKLSRDLAKMTARWDRFSAGSPTRNLAWLIGAFFLIAVAAALAKHYF